jgi:nucleoside-diphosphate-sugar epimerase
MKICIVGASGYIGSSLRSYFLASGIEVVCFSSSKISKSYNYTDLEDIDKCVEILSDVDTLFYLCSPDHQETENDPGNSVNIVLSNLGHILNAKKKLSNLKIVYFSTAQIFNAVPQEETITDQTNNAPNNYYGLFHVYGENMLNYFREKYNNSDLVSLRLTNSYGFLCSQTSKWRAPAVNELISSAHEKGLITMQSDGSPFRDFIEMSALIETCARLVNANEVPRNLIVGSGVTINISYIATSIQNVFSTKYGKKITINTNGKIMESKIKPSPRYMVDGYFCEKQSASEIDELLKKAILDYERFIK